MKMVFWNNLCKDQINVINNNWEDDIKGGDGAKADDGIKTENSEIIDNLHHNYTGNE